MIKNFFKSMAVAFSIYSKLPMPRFKWESGDMKYHMCFFPLVGAVIGVVEWLWYMLANEINISKTLFVMCSMVIPLIITGGFHVDGYMDTIDALSSYQSREKKLDILKDPHIGAFSVIGLVVITVLSIGCMSEISSENAFRVLYLSFFMSRALSGISAFTFPKAKKEGMLNSETKTDNKKLVVITLALQLVLGAALVLSISKVYGVVLLASMIIMYGYYYIMSTKQFGGITGDMAGFFVTVSEVVALIGITVTDIIVR